MAGVNYDLYGGGVMGGYQAAQARDKQNMLAQQQMQQVTRQNQLGEMQLAEAQRAQQEQNQLRQLYGSGQDVTSPEFVRQVYGVSPQQGMAYEETLGKRQKAMTEGQKAQVDLVDAKLKQSQTFLQRVRTPAEYIAWHEGNHADPVLGPVLASKGVTVDSARKDIEDALAQPGGFEKLLQQSQLGIKDFAEMNKAQIVSPGASVYQGGKFVGQAPEKAVNLPDIVDEYNFAKTPAGGGFKGSLIDYKSRVAAAGRAPAAAPAVTVTQVVDPKDPSRMLTVDARQYRGGSLGSPGVVGVGGKEPGLAVRETKEGEKVAEKTKARETVDNLVATLRDNYNTLESEGGITSTQNRVGTNLASGMASSGAGQVAGRLLGTKAQSERNKIAQTRPLLLAAIKNATGMSAKQMDSNVELKMYLAAATDPTLDVESNRAALNNLEKLYGLGSSTTPQSKKLGTVDTNNPLLK